MLQNTLPSGESFMNGQTFGSLQHAPQFTHSPLRLLETGNTAVKVLFVLASHVFLLSVINRNFPNDGIETTMLTNIRMFCYKKAGKSHPT